MTLVVGVPKYSYPPFFNSCAIYGLTRNNRCQNPGLDAEILGTLLRMANLSYKTVTTSFQQGVHIEQGDTWNGLFGDIINGTLSTLVYAPNIVPTRNRYFDFTIPIYSGPFVIVYKSRDDSFENQLTSLFVPFSRNLWVVLCLFLIAIFSLWLVSSWHRVDRAAWEFFGFFKGDFERCDFSTMAKSRKFYFVSLFIFTIVFSTLYQGVLLLSFVHPYKQPLFNSVNDLLDKLESGRLKIVSDQDVKVVFRRMVIHGKTLTGRREANDLLQFADVQEDMEVVVNLVKSGSYIFPTTEDTGTYVVENNCGLTLMHVDNERGLPAGFIFAKNSSLVPVLNSAMQRSYPMIEYYAKKYRERKDKLEMVCEDNVNKKRETVFALSISNLSAGFILLLFGLALSVLVFGLENVKKHRFYKTAKYELKKLTWRLQFLLRNSALNR